MKTRHICTLHQLKQIKTALENFLIPTKYLIPQKGKRREKKCRENQMTKLNSFV